MATLSRPSTARRRNISRRHGDQTRVLVVGDEVAVATTINARIRDLYACEFATDGPTAIDAADHGRVGAVVFCGLGGRPQPDLDLLRSLTARQGEAAVLVVSEIADPAAAERALSAGADDYLLMPLANRQIEISLSSRLTQHQVQSSPTNGTHELQGWIERTMERAPLLIFMKDRQGRYAFANRETHRSLGVPTGAMIGLTDADLMLPASATNARSEDLRVLDRGEVIVGGEWTMSVADGPELTYLVAKFPIPDERGDVAGVFGMGIDVSAYKASEDLRRDLALEQRRLIDQLRRSREETVDRLTKALSWRDPGSGEHVGRMGAVAAYLGELVGLEPERVILLRAAAPMHDVGKIAIPDEILRKPGRLDDAEQEVMQHHARIGFEILEGSQSEVLRLGAKIALTHHERWDGRGYPRGLRGEEIPIEGRIAAVADVFDALLSDRPYREPLRPDEVRQVIADGRGSHYDPVVADALLENFETALRIRSTEGQIGLAKQALSGEGRPVGNPPPSLFEARQLLRKASATFSAAGRPW